MKPDILTDEKVIITVAITGGIHGKWANECIPITPEEQAQDALECYEAGAAICHLHVRGEDGQNTPDISVYNKAVSLIRERCPIITQIGNGIGAWIEYGVKTSSKGKPYGQAIVMPSLKQRLNLLTIKPQPEMFTINAGTFEFRTPYGSHTFDNPLDFNKKFVKKCKKMGCGIEIEVYDSGHIANIIELVDMGILEPPLHFSLVLGIKGGAPATPSNLLHLIDQLPEKSTWQVVTVGKYNLRTTVIAMCMGGNIRTGLEDTIYYEKGELVKSNAQLVERMVRLAKEIGREPATVDEAKDLLGLK
ncbi:MAG: 3-keto-5-aminohexanoate cleavage protein [Candidatus Lokiarchaeota archaeon]|nr:3-keto-5-aminohexanoate cleavage protein [Candidatus Lokiarchaeota archaeon]MBD3342398.1 3-keto-5-aminohexanoate cleavage protein [Candidatus Lokiarchaeota archaeon]